MACNCKTKERTDKLIRKVEELDHSKSKDHTRMNKTAMKVLYDIKSVAVYILFGIMFTLSFFLIIPYMAITRKSIKINTTKFLKNGQQQVI